MPSTICFSSIPSGSLIYRVHVAQPIGVGRRRFRLGEDGVVGILPSTNAEAGFYGILIETTQEAMLVPWSNIAEIAITKEPKPEPIAEAPRKAKKLSRRVSKRKPA